VVVGILDIDPKGQKTKQNVVKLISDWNAAHELSQSMGFGRKYVQGAELTEKQQLHIICEVYDELFSTLSSRPSAPISGSIKSRAEKKRSSRYKKKTSRVFVTKHNRLEQIRGQIIREQIRDDTLTSSTNVTHFGTHDGIHNPHAPHAQHCLQKIEKRRRCVICRSDYREGKAGARRSAKLTSFECTTCDPPIALCAPVGGECYNRWHAVDSD
jgi:hypothetical protein